MSVVERPSGPDIAAALARVATRRILVFSPTIHFRLSPGDRALVAPGESVSTGTPIAERTPDAEVVDAGRLDSEASGKNGGAARSGRSAQDAVTSALWREGRLEPASESRAQMATKVGAWLSRAVRQERRRPPEPGKWWVGGGERRGKSGKNRPAPRVGGTLLFEKQGRWHAAAGEHHQIVESPVAGIVREARNSVEVTIQAAGAAIPGAIAAGEPSRGYLDVPRLTDGELWASALDVGRAGAIVVAGSRISAQAISRARAMSIRGLIAGSVGQGELRDLEASQLRQKASLAPSVPFGLIALDGHQRRPIATPVLALLAALSGREVAIVTDPPLLIFDVSEMPLPELPPDWIRVRSGIHAGREGRLLDTAGLYRFRSGVHLEAAVVRFVDETDTTILPFADLERFIF
jgi:DNA-binding NarL/FixJ family response regulator